MNTKKDVIALTAPQTLALQYLLNDIHKQLEYLDPKPEKRLLNIYDVIHFKKNLYDFFNGSEDVDSLGETFLKELRDIFIICEERNWSEFLQSNKRNKTLKKLTVISEAAGEGSWTLFWKKNEAYYEEIFKDELGEEYPKYEEALSNQNEDTVAQQIIEKEKEAEVKYEYLIKLTEAVKKADLTSNLSREILNKAYTSIERLSRGHSI